MSPDFLLQLFMQEMAGLSGRAVQGPQLWVDSSARWHCICSHVQLPVPSTVNLHHFPEFAASLALQIIVADELLSLSLLSEGKKNFLPPVQETMLLEQVL